MIAVIPRATVWRVASRECPSEWLHLYREERMKWAWMGVASVKIASL